MKDDYELIDSGFGKKYERFGNVSLVRPCSQALWRPADESSWRRATATFDREDGNHWHGRNQLPEHWNIETAGIKFRLSGTDFGHLGIFPEQRAQWKWIRETVSSAVNSGRNVSVLNLFAYSGGSTLAAAMGGAKATHLDASRGMVQWASENASLNGLDGIRGIVDDAHKFMQRELRRGRKYDGIILDPPTFGRGEGGEMYKIERDLMNTLKLCRDLLTDDPLFILLSSHTPGCTPQVLENVIFQATAGIPGNAQSGEMLLTGADDVFPLPSGTYVRWTAKGN